MSSDAFVHAAAGSAGGCVAMALTYPLVNLSTRAQVETKKPEHAGESTVKTIKRIIRTDGWTTLYDGLSSSLVGIAVTNGIYYLFFEETRAVILRRRSKVVGALTTVESMLASFIAGCATSILSNPIWTVNTKQMVQASLDDDPDATVQHKIDPKTGEKVAFKKAGFFKTAIKLYQKEGLLAFWRGIGPALILVINPVIAYTTFEQLKNIIVARRANAAALRLPAAAGRQSITSKPVILPLSNLDNFLLGAFTKLLATGLTYPYLVVKSRMQAGAAHGHKYKNAFHGLATIISQEGVSALYRGIMSKLVQSVLTAAFLFMSKDQFYLWTKALIRSTLKKIPKA